MNKEEELKLAKDHGLLPAGNLPKNPVERFVDYPVLQVELLAFANACEKIGMEKALAKICDALHGERNGDCAEAIRAAI